MIISTVCMTKNSGFSYLCTSLAWRFYFFYFFYFLNPVFSDCYCRIWIKIRGRCCQSFMAFTASSAAAPPSVWWWWTMCCRAPWRCTTSTIWRVPRTSGAPHAKSAPNHHPRSKIWTSRRCMRACISTPTPTMPWWRPCRGTVGCVYTKILSYLSSSVSWCL